MNKYIILKNPGHNRIYFSMANKIARLELEAVCKYCDIDIKDVKEESILKSSISFTTEKELSEELFKIIGVSSIYYSIFKVIEDKLLEPILLPNYYTFPESMVQILKYNGKTNEQFTRLMVNLAISVCKTNYKRPMLLDPMCGKGTTLYEGFIRGFDVKGIEINDQWSQEIQMYIVRFLKEGKYKHKAKKSKKSDNAGKKIANVFDLVAASTKTEYNENKVQEFQLINCDTRKSNLIIKKKSCDIIVSDLPYGVQHGSKSSDKTSMERSPINLLKEALPNWIEALKNKGSMVLSFNEHTMKYDDLCHLIESMGLTVLKEEIYSGYIHRVDQAINRNLIVAVK